MSTTGPHPGPPSQQSTDPAQIPMWVILASVGVLLVAGAFSAFVVLGQGDGDRDYPDRWDPRVAPLIRVVEKQRGLSFRHPVEVRFLSPAKFKDEITSEVSDLDADEREELEQAGGLLRALGLLSGDIDLFKAIKAATRSGTLAFYSFEDERITIRGKKMTPSVRSTVVHELTHVLQDQHFSIGDRFEEFEEDAEADKPDTTEASVLRALVEGDAERIEENYRESRPPKLRRAIEAAEAREASQAQSGFKGVPKIVLTLIGAPYALGQGLTQAAAVDGGNVRVDRLFQNTPTHETALLDPFSALSGETLAEDVEIPGLEKDEKRFGSGEFGVLTWYLMLAERIPLKDALAAADGWGGDAYVAFDRDGTSCARIAYEGGKRADTDRMFRALQRWTAGSTGSSSTVARKGNELLFESCDPGRSATTGNNASTEAISLVSARTFIAVGAMQAGAPEKISRCLADVMIREFSLAQITDPGFGSNDGSVRARVQQLAAGCR